MTRGIIALAVVWLAVGCASAGAGDTDPGAAGEGDCPIEVRNETEVPLAVSYRGGLVQVGTLTPGGRLHFNVGCRDGAVVVLGNRAADQNRTGATCTVSDRVTPVEGEVVIARLRVSPSGRRSSSPTGCRRGSR